MAENKAKKITLIKYHKLHEKLFHGNYGFSKELG
jgi:hypothetical protein